MTCLNKTEDDPEVDPHRDSVLDVNLRGGTETTFHIDRDEGEPVVGGDDCVMYAWE